MKPREYCCCAIPIVNAGIYAALIEQFVLGIVAGTLSIATQSSMCSWPFAFRARSPKLTFSVSYSCRCCHTRSSQMGLRHRLLHRCRHPDTGFHRRLKGERNRSAAWGGEMDRKLSADPSPGEICFVQAVSLTRLVHHHRWIFRVRRLDHHFRHPALYRSNQLRDRVLLRHLDRQ